MKRAWLYGVALAGCLGARVALAQTVTIGGVGEEGQGAGVVVTNLDGNPRPELIVMAYDNPPGENSFRYRVGYNVSATGTAASWTTMIQAPGVGAAADGAGLAITNLDADARPEVIAMAYDDPAGANEFRYRVGFNVGSNGQAQSWGDPIRVAGVGYEAEGAGVAITNLNGNTRPDIVFMAYDAPTSTNGNSFRYVVGYDLDSSGKVQDWTYSGTGSRPTYTVNGVGWFGQGAGVSLANLDGDERVDMLLMAYDNPAGGNTFRYRVGLNLAPQGSTSKWTTGYTMVAGLSAEAAGADLTLFALSGPYPELIALAYDNPSGFNRFGYSVVHNIVPPKRVHVEMDKLAVVAWPPTSVTRNSTTRTLSGLYELAGISLSTAQDEGQIMDLQNGGTYSDAECDAFRAANMNEPPTESILWHIHAGFLTMHDDNVAGMMFDTDDRRAFAVFANTITGNDRYLRTTAHELGHALNLEHNDGDAWRASGPDGTGTSIMNQTSQLATGWDFTWSAAELHHFYHHPLTRWRPNNGVDFGDCH